jgi:hypothetical protein
MFQMETGYWHLHARFFGTSIIQSYWKDIHLNIQKILGRQVAISLHLYLDCNVVFDPERLFITLVYLAKKMHSYYGPHLKYHR